jgi:hypothetical protein
MEHYKKETKLKIEQQKLELKNSSNQHQDQDVNDAISVIGNNLLFDKVKLTDIVKALNVKTLKAAKSWCKRKGLVIIKFGSDHYVNLIDFQLQLDKPFLDDLRAKYPNNWAEVYHHYKTSNWAKIAGQFLNTIVKSKFTVQGNAANDFMNKMKGHG